MKEFEQIFKEYSPMVYRYLYSLCRDTTLSEELTAETFYQAYLHIDSFREKSALQTWLFQIAKHAYYRESKRRLRFIGNLKHNDKANTIDFAEQLHEKEQALKLHKQLHTLQEPFREVFMLRIFGELRFKEIAGIFDKTEIWAKVTYYRAKEKLMAKLEEPYED